MHIIRDAAGLRCWVIVAALATCPTPVTAQIQSGFSGFAQAIRDGSFDLALRYRYEFVDQQDFALDAKASTLRTRFTFSSADFNGIGLIAEIDDLREIGADSFNSTRNGKVDRPIVAGPAATDLNQLYVSYSAPTGTRYALGRQSLTYPSRRYVGSVNWRQNEQTFDGLTIVHAVTPEFEVGYAYISNANRVFGPDPGVPEPDFRGAFQLLDSKFALGADVALRAYGYFLDFDTAADLSSATLGMRVTGNHALSNALQLNYTAEYAQQRDYASNPTNYSADYIVLEAGARWNSFSILAGVEILEGSGRPREVFTTPLAALHQYNGWSDQFLSIPDGGLEDRYLKLRQQIGTIQFDLVFHDFSANTGGGQYGRELGLAASWPFLENYSALLKAADYQAEGLNVDVRKLWFMLSANF